MNMDSLLEDIKKSLLILSSIIIYMVVMGENIIFGDAEVFRRER